MAVKTNDFSLVQKLIEMGSEIDALNKNNQSPLHISISNKIFEIFDFLISKNANIQLNSNGSLIYLACEANDLKTVEFLLQMGLDINEKNIKNGETPLHISVIKKNLEIIKLLISNGSDINLLNNDLESPIFHAIKGKDIDIIKFLIQNGSNLLLLSKNKDSILHIACDINDSEIIKLLLSNGAYSNNYNNVNF